MSLPKAVILLSASLLVSLTAVAQTLARPGWAGSGLAPEVWYQHAVFYRVETPADIPTETQLPSLQAFGVDALLLTGEDVRTPPAPAPAAETGVLSLDDLLFECSRLHIRVLIPLDLSASPATTLALAKSWLYRGAGGFVLHNLPASNTAAAPATGVQESSQKVRESSIHSIHLSKSPPDAPIVSALHSLLLSFPGSRVLIADNMPLSPSIQLQIVSLATPSGLPQTLERPLLALGSGPLTPIAATRLLATPFPALLSSSTLSAAALHRIFSSPALAAEPETPAPPPPPPPSDVYGAYKPYVPKDPAAERRKEAEAKKAQEEADTIPAVTFPVQPMYDAIGTTPEAQVAFYHRLVQLHRARTALASASLAALDPPVPVFGWLVARPGSPAVLVLCNPSASPQRVDVYTRQTYRTLLHTAGASGVVNANAVLIGPQGVYIGQALSRGQ